MMTRESDCHCQVLPSTMDKSDLISLKTRSEFQSHSMSEGTILVLTIFQKVYKMIPSAAITDPHSLRDTSWTCRQVRPLPTPPCKFFHWDSAQTFFPEDKGTEAIPHHCCCWYGIPLRSVIRVDSSWSGTDICQALFSSASPKLPKPLPPEKIY